MNRELLQASLEDRGMSDREVARKMVRSYFGQSGGAKEVKSVANQIGYLKSGSQERCGRDFLNQLAKALNYPPELLSDVDGSFRDRLSRGWNRPAVNGLPGRVQLAEFRFWRDVISALGRDFPDPKERNEIGLLLSMLTDPAHWRYGLHSPQGFGRHSISGKKPKQWTVSEPEEVAWASLISAMAQILQPWIRGVANLNLRVLWLLYRSVQAPESLPRKHQYYVTMKGKRNAAVRAAKAAGAIIIHTEEEQSEAIRSGIPYLRLFPLPPGTQDRKMIPDREWQDLE